MKKIANNLKFITIYSNHNYQYESMIISHVSKCSLVTLFGIQFDHQILGLFVGLVRAVWDINQIKLQIYVLTFFQQKLHHTFAQSSPNRTM